MSQVPFSRRVPVLWTRGAGCRELAEALSPIGPVRVSGHLEEACIAHRADLVVSRRLASSFDLVSQAVPVDLDLERTRTVVAAVAGGPHTPLVARLARRLAERLDISAMIACAYRDDAGREAAVSMVERLYGEVPEVEYRLVEAPSAEELVDGLPEAATLVLGAPGGNWLQRTFFGQGARLRQQAPAGAVVVRSSPARVFQAMGDPVFVGPLREAGDILRIHAEQTLAVVDRAVLVGIVERDVLDGAEPGVLVSELMGPPESVPMDAALDEVGDLADRFRPDPIPVTDEEGRLVGGLVLP